MLLAGLGLFAWSAVALSADGSAPVRVKDGGTLLVNDSGGDIGPHDPAVDYETVGWAVEDATGLKLLSYADRPGQPTLIPEAAIGMPSVSADGRTFTFTVRKGFRFNTGEPVTAANFAYEIDRVLSPKEHSPGVAFLLDVEGAKAVIAGKAKTPVGLTADGMTLRIRLVAPDADFLSRIAMNFFTAVPTSYPIGPALQVFPAAAGPYYVSSYTVNRQVVLSRNPFYGGHRPHHLDRIAFTMNTDLPTSYLQVERGQADLDLDGVPSTAWGVLFKKYGVNRSRFWVLQGGAILYLALNMSRPPFNDPDLRKAVNYAIDRRALVEQAGKEAGSPIGQILPPAIGGYHKLDVYPVTPDLAKAKALAAGKTANATLYLGLDPSIQAMGEIITADLARIGIKVTARAYSPGVSLASLGNPKTPYNMTLAGWIADYYDPYDFINVLLCGCNITAQNNLNLAQMNIPVYDRRMKAAAKLFGTARYAAYAKLDADIMRSVAPWAPISLINGRAFVSARTGCVILQFALGGIDMSALCIK
jgi:ABC-type transport system substrate-binding protein